MIIDTGGPADSLTAEDWMQQDSAVGQLGVQSDEFRATKASTSTKDETKMEAESMLCKYEKQ